MILLRETNPRQTNVFVTKIASYLPCTTIICCCSRKMALCRYPPKAVLPLLLLTCCVCVDCLRFLTLTFSAVWSTVLLTSFRVFIMVFFSGAALIVILAISAVRLRTSSGLPSSGQLHCAHGGGRKKTWTRQAVEMKMAIKLIAVAKTAQPNPSLPELPIPLKCVNRFPNESL